MKNLLFIALAVLTSAQALAAPISAKEQFRSKNHSAWIALLEKQSNCQFKYMKHHDIGVYADCLYAIADQSEKLVVALDDSPFKAAIDLQMGTLEKWKKMRDSVCTESAIKDNGAFVAQYNSACLARQSLDRVAGSLNLLRESK